MQNLDMYADELEFLIDEYANEPRPPNWSLPVRGVAEFVLGSIAIAPEAGRGIAAKYIGDPSSVKCALAGIPLKRAAAFSGPPGVGKSFVASLIAYATAGRATHNIIAGSEGTAVSHVTFALNYGLALREGASNHDAVIPSALMHGMLAGEPVIIEEISRMSPQASGALLVPLSEQIMPIPVTGEIVTAVDGYYVLATYNPADAGVRKLGDALKRRMYIATFPLPKTSQVEQEIVRSRMLQHPTVEFVLDDEVNEMIQEIVQTLRDWRNVKMRGEPIYTSPDHSLGLCQLAIQFSAFGENLLDSAATCLATFARAHTTSEEDAVTLLKSSSTRTGKEAYKKL